MPRGGFAEFSMGKSVDFFSFSSAPGKYVNHKGRNRNFTSPEQLEEERKNEEKKKSVEIE